jgi:hypothetical protein
MSYFLEMVWTGVLADDKVFMSGLQHAGEASPCTVVLVLAQMYLILHRNIIDGTNATKAIK